MKHLVIGLMMIFVSAVSFGEQFAFVERDIAEILFAVSQYKGFPIVSDDTVFGTANFRCAGENFDDAFESFLQQTRLYAVKSTAGWTISRIKVEKQFDAFSLDAYDVTPAQMLEKIGVATGLCVVAENLPQIKHSLHTGFCSAEEILYRIAALCTGFELTKEPSGFFRLSRMNAQAITAQQTAGRAEFVRANALFSCTVVNAALGFVLEKLFTLAEKQFCLVSGGEGKIVRADFSGKSFEDTLHLLCLQGGVEAVQVNDVYYIFASKNAKDRVAGVGKQWNWCSLRFKNTADFLALAAKRFPAVETIAVNIQGDFLYRCDASDAEDFLRFVHIADTAQPVQLVQLKYVRTSDFLAHLPPFVEKNQIVDSGQGDCFYFTGSEDAYAHLLAELPSFDKPVKRITYDLLIMQYHGSEGNTWAPNFRVDRLSLGDINSAAALLGSVLDLNVDVVGAFGLKFAAELQAAITNAKAHVFADTTLNGMSGSTINFQNTNTYRYRDNNLDPDTGKPIYSGITKEISSGLKLEVTGTVTGDGMITSKITASVSRQGADVSASTGNPPPTSEKVITTEVRAKSGEPVVLSGLIQNEETETISRMPLLSRIPVLGNVFKSKAKSAERTELVIYLVPSTETDKQQTTCAALDVPKEKSRLLKEFVK